MDDICKQGKRNIGYDHKYKFFLECAQRTNENVGMWTRI